MDENYLIASAFNTAVSYSHAEFEISKWGRGIQHWQYNLPRIDNNFNWTRRNEAKVKYKMLNESEETEQINNEIRSSTST